jgi:polysaccharide export outer membrane protein
MNKLIKLIRAVIISILGFTAVSCVTQKDVEILQNRDNITNSFTETNVEDYHIKPFDELYIEISSLDEAAATVFTNAATQQYSSQGSIQPYGASLISYTVDKAGFLSLPLIGQIQVKDKTIPQSIEIIKDSLYNILNQPIVTMKLVNRYVSVLGEVRNPGHFAYSQEKLTLFDALGIAGDVNEYGNRKEVLLTRNENGKNTRVILDLTKSEILSSKYYILKPNDLVYVKPLRKKFWGMREFPFAITLSAISTAILLYNVVK